MNDPEQIPNIVRAILGKPHPRIRCRFGIHAPADFPLLDHDKRLRKVYSVQNIRICRHCHKVLDDAC